ncbi:hypothetical protein HYR65_03065, partial [Candidatus Azambacteria bacterium]|nr:hypothetical protein [Candidatus Azambacteria bacterium]
MKHHLIRILHILRHITPDAKQKAEFRHALVLRVHADTAHERMSRRAKPSSVFSFFRLAPTTAGVIAAAVILGTGGVSFAAQNALPGERLYPVKLATERARLAMVGDKAEKT